MEGERERERERSITFLYFVKCCLFLCVFASSSLVAILGSCIKELNAVEERKSGVMVRCTKGIGVTTWHEVEVD